MHFSTFLAICGVTSINKKFRSDQLICIIVVAVVVVVVAAAYLYIIEITIRIAPILDHPLIDPR